MASESSPSLFGFVVQINLSAGGVPKLPQPEAELTVEGLVGDGHHDREHHGGPERAVCLYSLECIQALQSEGHPIFPGAAGENLTIAGLDWTQIQPGVRFHVGSEVILAVTRYTSPCSTIANAFLNGDFSRISQKTHPGWSRVYACVVRGGKIQVGAGVKVEI